MDRIIVSRHAAAIEFIARELASIRDEPWRIVGPDPIIRDGHRSLVLGRPRPDETDDSETIPVLDAATADDVRGKVVYGNIPLHLAAVAESVTAIEFSGAPPRGAEYTLAEMDAAGARLVSYGVLLLPEGVTRDDYLYQGGFCI